MKKRWQNNQQININIYILIYLQIKTKNKLRKAQSDAWLVGIRAKRAKELAEKEAEKKK